MSYASLTAAFVDAIRKITALYPEPKEVPAFEIEAIQERCRRSLKEYGHAECPWPVSWPLRRGIWMDELAKNSEDRGIDKNHEEQCPVVYQENPYGVEIYEDSRVINLECEECRI